MIKRSHSALKLTSASFVLATTFIAAPVIAQSAAGNTPAALPGKQATASDQDIIVTGSRIPQPNLRSTSPITSVTSEDVKIQGIVRTEDLINNLPQVFAGQGSNVSNGATGTSTVDIRGLGPSRTLVLIDGRRLGPDVTNAVADINFIPAQIIKRADLLTGGAGSVYGADAVAGVVNFVLDRDFTGFSVDGQFSGYEHNNNASSDITTALSARNFSSPSGSVWDGATGEVSVKFGAGFDDHRGHLMGYATYLKSDPVTQAERDYSACTLSGHPGAFLCGGSSTSATGRFFPDAGPSLTVSGTSFVPYSSAKNAFNYGPLNYYHRPDERYNAGVFADYEVSPAFKPYLDAMFMDDRSIAQIAPSGDFGNTLTLPCDNPLLSAQELATVCIPANYDGTTTRTNGTVVQLIDLQIFRRNVEGGNRQDDQEHTDYRIVTGSKGRINNVFSYDAYFQYGKNIYAETYFNDVSVVKLGRALNVTTGANGQPVCESVLDGTDPNCVPWNIFANGGVTSAATNYLNTPGFKRGNTQETVANASVSADFGQYGIKTPWDDTGLQANVGYEYRKEALTLTTDQEFTTGDLAGQGGPTIGVAGSYKVSEIFGEARLPLANNRPFFQDFYLEGSYRHSVFEYTSGHNNADSYKIAGSWTIVKDITLRAGYNVSVRAPNVVELYTAQSVGLDGTTDPCAGTVVNGTVNGFSAAQCARTGVTAAQFGNITPNTAAQYNGLVGGNPNLQPEKGKTFTAGVLLRPRYVPGLSISADYYHITISNLIGTIGADLIITQCVTNSLYCGDIHRDQFGSLWRTPNGFIQDTNFNVGQESTSGVDVVASYQHHFNFGRIGFNYNATISDNNGYVTALGTSVQCAGQFGPSNCGVPAPKYRHVARLTYGLDDGISITGTWRLFSSVTNVSSSYTYNIPTQSYFDLAATIPVLKRIKFRLGVNNVFDKSPPIIGNQALSGVTGNGNTYPQVYDALGRYLFVGANVTF